MAGEAGAVRGRVPRDPDDPARRPASVSVSVREGPGTWAAFTTCCLVWSSTFLLIRFGNDAVPPVWGATLRLGIAAPLLAGLALARRAPWPRGRPLRAALWFGAVDFGVSLPLLYWGETRVPSGVAAILFATIPLSTSLFARAFGLERLHPRTLLAALLALAGVAVLVSSQLAGRIPPMALIAVLLASATASLAGVLLKRAPGAHPLATNALAHAAGAMLCLLASVGLGERRLLPTGWDAWAPILYLVLFGSIVAFVAFAWLVQRWSVTRLSFIAVITPVLGMALGAAFRGERLTPASGAGAAIVIAAVVVALARPRERAASS